MSADPDARTLGAADAAGDDAVREDAVGTDHDVTAAVSPAAVSTAATGPDADADSDGLLSRLALIEQQPLEDRAAAFTQLYEQLRAALDAGDAAPR